jgi:sporulation protein YlmC with PRC-barrel domain
MKKTLSTLAAAAVLMASTAVAPVFAQTSAAPATQTQVPNTTTGTGTTGAATTLGATGTYLTQQAPTQISANDYIGQSIYNGENKSIGSVTDLILEQNGGIVAAVVGVGGFLGMGQKDVAVPMSKIMVNREDGNKLRLTTTETAEALKAAPEFKTLDDQASAQSKSTDRTTTSSTTSGTMAPAGGNATTPATTNRP